MMKVLLTAAECAPFAKVGGLADVVGALPKALHKLGVDVRVVIPRYKEISNLKSQIPNKSPISNSKFAVDFGFREKVEVFESTLPDSEVPIYFLENDKYLSSGDIYFSKDAVASTQSEIERFAFFSKAVAALMLRDSLLTSPWLPDVVHANDWHTGMVPNLVKNSKLKVQNYSRPALVFTIHNLANQGFSDLSILKNLNSITSESKLIKWDAQDDNLDFMLQGITNADVVSTVSPTYAKEILTPEFSEGLHQVLKDRQGRLFGILNGIDYQIWNPETDRLLEFNYDLTQNLEEGLSKKVGNKLHLQKHLHLAVDEKVPLVGMITRLADQKGIDLVLDSLEEIFDLGCQLVILGVGDPKYEQGLKVQGSRFEERRTFAFINRFDEQLAHHIYAAADLFLMPSKFEPCGLVQMIAMRYGALPIVRETGGLKDTVQDGQNGFAFNEYSPEALLQAVERALSCCGLERPDYQPMVKNAAIKDFSWEARAKEYLQLYERALKYRDEARF